MWHVGPIIITMTISFDGKICGKSRILSLLILKSSEASCAETVYCLCFWKSLLNADTLCHGMVLLSIF